MSAQLSRLLAEFVNREDEMAEFCSILDGAGPQILVIWGDGGVGKSYLVAKMMHETANRKLKKSEVVISQMRNGDYLSIMRKIRDDLGEPVCFSSFNDLVNYFTKPQYDLNVTVRSEGNIRILENAQLGYGVQTGDIGVIVKDIMVQEQRTDLAISEEERMTRLTDAFLGCLQRATKNETLVVFLDAVEKLIGPTALWLWEELVGAAQSGKLPNVKIVLGGRQDPKLSREWRGVANIHQLKPFTVEHIIQYLNRRGISEAANEIAKILMVSSEGNVLKLATLVDAYVDMSSDSA